MPVLQVSFCQGFGVVLCDAPQYGLKPGDEIPNELPAEVLLQVETQGPFAAASFAKYRPLLGSSTANHFEQNLPGATIRPPRSPYVDWLNGS